MLPRTTMTDLDLKLAPSTAWSHMTHDEQLRALFKKQKELLDEFLSHGAIDRRQYEKSLTCMAEKMGIDLNKET
jgi:hypothetical protein